MGILDGHSFGTSKRAEYRKLHSVSKNINVTCSPDVVIRKWSKGEHKVVPRTNSGYIGDSQRNEKTNGIHFLTMLFTSWAGTLLSCFFFLPLIISLLWITSSIISYSFSFSWNAYTRKSSISHIFLQCNLIL